VIKCAYLGEKTDFFVELSIDHTHNIIVTNRILSQAISIQHHFPKNYFGFWPLSFIKTQNRGEEKSPLGGRVGLQSIIYDTTS
jgi:hypothetical protein